MARPASATPLAPPSRVWREPTASLPLRWGRYDERLVLGAALIVGGAAAIAGSNTWTLWLLGLGTVAHVAGWLILPSAGWRRVVVVAPATLAAWLLLTGPRFLGVLVIPYLAWLLVRHRPGRSYATVLFVVANAVLLGRVFSSMSEMLPALAISAAVLVLSALAARVLHRARRPSPSANPQRPQADDP